MARGQGAAGHPGAPPAPRLTLLVHDRVQGEAALALETELGLALELSTPPGLAAMAGVGYCVALEELLGRPLWIDCGAEPGTALAALRAGARRILLRGAPATFGKVADIAAQLGAVLRDRPPEPVLALAPGEDAAAALRAARAPPDPS